MRKSTAAFAAASFVIIAFALAGCGSWFQSANKPANDSVGIANDHLKKASALEASVTADAASLQAVPYTKAGAKDGLKLTASILAALETERAELVEAKAAIDAIVTLQVDENLKQYARLESAAIDARVALADAETRLYTGFDRLYTAFSGSANADTQETIAAIDQMRQEVSSLGQAASAAAKAASDFFAANKLGG
jgi:hypothetical protein